MELPDPLDQPDRITPDQEEAEDTDISDSEEECKTLAKGMKKENFVRGMCSLRRIG